MTSKDTLPEQLSTSDVIPKESSPRALLQSAMSQLRRLRGDHPVDKEFFQLEQRINSFSDEDKELFNNLQLHQIELELQNEELRLAQLDLEHARARYFDLYDLAPVGYCSIKPDGLILEANLTFCTMVDLNRRELGSKNIQDLIYNEDQDIYYFYSRKVSEDYHLNNNEYILNTPTHSRSQPQCELRLVRKAGTHFWANLQESIVQQPTGDLIHFVVLNDISERKQEEKQRAKLEAKTRHIQKAKSLELMAGSVAHLFNNHLQVVLGNLELALRQLPHPSEEYLMNAIQATRRSSDVSELLLTYLGQHETKDEPVDLCSVCEKLIDEINTHLPKTLTIRAELELPGPVISANENQIRQVLTCLFTNAIESMEKSEGEIEVVIKKVSPSSIPNSHVTLVEWLSTADFYACIQISDAGTGIADIDRSKIFDPFFTTKFTGRGLGLAVAMGLVKTWRGMIFVDSEAGIGSCFRVFIPLVKNIVPKRLDHAITNRVFQEGKTVLLVDDDPMLCEIVRALFEHLGFTVITATGGKEALTFCEDRNNTIDCLLTDLTMPDMDGWETLSAIRKIRPDLPAILSSGYDEAQAMHGDHEEQPQAFLHKPFGLEELERILTKILT